ncbi:MAG: thermonuclease family protein [Planctomycetaceae bacterium]
MKRFARGLLFLPLLSLALFSPFSLASGKTYHRGQVIKVFDGDTLLVRINGHEEFIRLREIDAPEIASRKQKGQEPWGRKAREFALSRLKPREVRLETENRDERDAYGRLLAYVFVGESLLNREMVESGNAFFYRGPVRGRYAALLEHAEEMARIREVGVWDRKNGLKKHPKDFRARHHRDDGLFSSTPRGKTGKSGSFQENPVPKDKIVEDKRTRVYHLPGSPSAMRVSAKNRVFFDSAENAEKAGCRRADQIRNAELGMRNYEKKNKLIILKIEASPPSAPVDLSLHLSPC